MVRKSVNLLMLVLVTAVVWYTDFSISSTALFKLRNTFISLSIFYFFFKVFLEGVVVARVHEKKARYSLRKAISTGYFAILSFVLGGIWVEDVQALLVAYGLVGAGVAVSLQDFFKNIVGGIILLTSGEYRVGDRIEIAGKVGDVIDVGMMYTTIMEIQEWVGGDQATGRLAIIPNGYVLYNTINNYTKDNMFIWDEITVPITYESNWKIAQEMILEVTKKETEGFRDEAEKEISQLSSKYFVTPREAEPAIFMKLTDNWIEMNVRYIALARERRPMQNNLSKLILERFESAEDVEVASETLRVMDGELK